MVSYGGPLEGDGGLEGYSRLAVVKAEELVKRSAEVAALGGLLLVATVFAGADLVGAARDWFRLQRGE